MAPILGDYQYQFTDNGVVLDTFGNFDLLSIQGLDTPEVRVTEQDRDGAHGEFVLAQFLKGRVITIEGAVKIQDNSEVQPYLDTLKANYQPRLAKLPFHFKHPGVAQRVIFANSLGIRYTVDTTWNSKYVQFQALLKAEDPRIYAGAEVSRGPFGIAVAEGGVQFPIDFPMTFGSVTSGGPVTFANEGTLDSYPVYTFTGPLASPTLRNVTLDRDFRINYTLVAGSVAVVNSGNRTIIINGSYRLDTLDGTRNDWPVLAPGDNSMLFSASSGNGSYNVTYRSAWL